MMLGAVIKSPSNASSENEAECQRQSLNDDDNDLLNSCRLASKPTLINCHRFA